MRNALFRSADLNMKSVILTICTAYIITDRFTQAQGYDCTTGHIDGGAWSCPDLTDANIHKAIMNQLHDPTLLTYGPIEKWKTDKLTNFACFFATENGECNDLHLAHGLQKWQLEPDTGPSRADRIKLFNADLSAWDTSGVKFIISCTDHMSSTLCVADNDCKWEDDSCELKVEVEAAQGSSISAQVVRPSLLVHSLLLVVAVCFIFLCCLVWLATAVHREMQRSVMLQGKK